VIGFIGSVDCGTSSGLAMVGDVLGLGALDVVGVVTDGVALGVLVEGELVEMPEEGVVDESELDGVGV